MSSRHDRESGAADTPEKRCHRQ
jgi:hypothetical protein